MFSTLNSDWKYSWLLLFCSKCDAIFQIPLKSSKIAFSSHLDIDADSWSLGNPNSSPYFAPSLASGSWRSYFDWGKKNSKWEKVPLPWVWVLSIIFKKKKNWEIRSYILCILWNLALSSYEIMRVLKLFIKAHIWNNNNEPSGDWCPWYNSKTLWRPQQHRD